MTTEPEWELKITHDGIWPYRWAWVVRRWDGMHYDIRFGAARTKDRAQHKAAAARLDIERNDVQVML